MQLEDIETNNVTEDEMNPRLGYAMVRIDNFWKKITRGVTGYIRD